MKDLRSRCSFTSCWGPDLRIGLALMMTTITGFRVLQSKINKLHEGDVLENIAYNQFRKIWAEAAQAYVRAATSEVLVDTGMSAATFFPLSRAISLLRLGVTGTPGIVRGVVARGKGRSFRDRPEFPFGRKRRPVPRRRDAKSGEVEGKKAFSLKFGSPKRPQFRFFFQAQVYQFARWEAQQKALAAGEAAFLESLEANIGDVNRVLQLFLRGRALPRGELRANAVDTIGNPTDG
ncbi:hypothetical protein OAF54_02880 [bacterium]|nr:hypothetical protein [bacterium]